METKYDISIIGAGIGGLVCGCYLAKAGLKVLIVEQHSRPGGYCASFERYGYRFDVGVHYLGGMINILGKILEELDLKDEIKFNRFNPTDKLIMPDNINYIYTNPRQTIEEFKNTFPKEKNNINVFFDFIMQKDFINVYQKVKRMSFQEFLDEFFIDFRLKATLEGLLLNFGLSAKKASAITSVLLYRDYILDGGYYPKGGMQRFSDALANKFNQFGGDVVLNTRVEKIVLKNRTVEGIILEKGQRIKSNFVISNADATQTFTNLLNNIDTREKILVHNLLCSPSLFALYVGINEDLRIFTNFTCNIWKFDTYEIDKDIFNNLRKSILMNNLPFFMMSFPYSHESDSINTYKNTIEFFLIAPFESEDFWNKYKDEIEKKIIIKADKILPNLKKYIKVKVVATPITFYKYTLNKNGAGFGWASTIDQIRATLFPPMTSIDNLFLVGHWCTTGSGQGGVPKVIFLSKKVSNLILNKIDKK